MTTIIENRDRIAGQGRGSESEALRWIGLIGIVSIAVMRCVIVFAPQVHFDVDPVSDSTPLGGFGPAGSLVLDVILLLSCAVAIIGEWRRGAGIDWKLFALALIPVPVVMWHGSSDAGDLWRGSTWACAAIACAIAAHLARDRTMRIVIIALHAAAIAIILVRGFNQIFIEHPAMVEIFDERKEQFFRDRGWDVDSSAARIYERRLHQPQPLGWFATTNVVASFVTFGLVFGIGLTIAATRAKLQGGWAAAMALWALACAIALWFTGSQGAIGATCIGAAFAVALQIWRNRARDSSRIPALIACALILLTLLGVIMRGALLPESFAGDKSLLFRWHYMIASARIFIENALLGVGPDGFQAAYTMHRVPRNPEEVASAHSMFIDWLCTLGISGFSWIGLVAISLWRGGRAIMLSSTADAQSEIAPAQRFAFRAAIIVAAVAFIPAFGYVEIKVLDPHSALIRLLAVFIFAAVACMMGYVLIRDANRNAEPWLFAAITALLIHSQIEMTFSQPGAGVWCLAIIGMLAAPTPRANANRQSILVAVITTTAIVTFAAWLMVTGALPAIAQQRAMADAESLLDTVRQNPDDRALTIARRQAAAAKLIEAHGRWPINARPLEAAATQLELASVQPQGVALGLLMHARDVIDRAVAEHRKPNSIAMAVGINVRLAQATGDQEYWQGAVQLARELTRIDPHGLSAWKRLGDVFWMAGERAESAKAYRHALDADANFELDELKRLSNRARSEIQRRMADAEEMKASGGALNVGVK
jgi:hypothetical protein